MRIYVASSWRNADQPDVVQVLRAEGHSVYDFRNPDMGPGKRGRGFHWSDIDLRWQTWSADEFRKALDHQHAIDGCASDLAGMMSADAVVLVNPCGRSAHLELGWAIGAGKRTLILLRDGDEPELMYRLADHLCTSLDELLARLRVDDG